MGSLLVLQLLMVSSSSGAHGSVWLMEQPGWQREEFALIEALRIYTGDLKVSITLGTRDAKANTTAARVRAAQDHCSSKVLLVAWFAAEPKGPILRILRCETLFVDEVTYSRRLPLENSAQNLALKIRGLLDQEPELARELVEANEIESVPSVPMTTLPDAEPDEGDSFWRPHLALSDLPAGDDVDGISETLPARHPADAVRPGPTWPGVEIGLAYSLGTTADFTGLRQGGSLQLGLVMSHLPLAVVIDGTLMTSMVHEGSGSRVSVTEFPIGLALTYRFVRKGWMLSAGPRVSMHVVHAEASSVDRRQGAVSESSFGMGATEQLSYNAWGQVSFNVALTNEILVPRRRFTVVGQEIAGSGFFQGTFAVGAVYRFF